MKLAILSKSFLSISVLLLGYAFFNLHCILEFLFLCSFIFFFYRFYYVRLLYSSSSAFCRIHSNLIPFILLTRQLHFWFIFLFSCPFLLIPCIEFLNIYTLPFFSLFPFFLNLVSAPLHMSCFILPPSLIPLIVTSALTS